MLCRYMLRSRALRCGWFVRRMRLSVLRHASAHGSTETTEGEDHWGRSDKGAPALPSAISRPAGDVVPCCCHRCSLMSLNAHTTHHRDNPSPALAPFARPYFPATSRCAGATCIGQTLMGLRRHWARSLIPDARPPIRRTRRLRPSTLPVLQPTRSTKYQMAIRA